MRRMDSIDPVTVEVIRSFFSSTARQMRNTLVRASFNPVIYEMNDFSLGLYNKKAELIAEGPGIPFFMGTLSHSIRCVVNYIGEDNIDDGDVFLCTYPHWSGSHPQDAVTIRPIFIDKKIFGYAAAKAHWIDLGAKDIYGTDTTDIWQEGLQIFGAKVVKAGNLNNEIVEIVRANTRLPDGVLGDLTAQISCCELGAKRIAELISKYSLTVVEKAVEQILNHGEAIARKAIFEMPDGVWDGSAYMDNDGISNQRIPFKAKIQIVGDRIIVDASECVAQQIGPVNCPIATSISFIRLVVKMIIAPAYEANEGFFRPLEIIIPERTILNPDSKSPVFLYGWAGFAFGDAMFEAFSKAVPERSIARGGGDIAVTMFSGADSLGNYFAGGFDECVGQGASMDSDGENALIHWSMGNSQNVPVEILEERYPILVDCYELLEDSAGPGRRRGGLGVCRRWKALSDMSGVFIVEQTTQPAIGVDTTRYAKASELTLKAGTSNELKTGKVSAYPLKEGDVVELKTGGGGGWGDPLAREVAEVLTDFKSGYVSEEKARSEYGVVVEFGEFGRNHAKVNQPQTGELRKYLGARKR